jgi:hypothetical protein
MDVLSNPNSDCDSILEAMVKGEIKDVKENKTFKTVYSDSQGDIALLASNLDCAFSGKGIFLFFFSLSLSLSLGEKFLNTSVYFYFDKAPLEMSGLETANVWTCLSELRQWSFYRCKVLQIGIQRSEKMMLQFFRLTASYAYLKNLQCWRKSCRSEEQTYATRGMQTMEIEAGVVRELPSTDGIH